MLFDEGFGRADSYDEQTMLAVSTDFKEWRRVTPSHRPCVRSAYGSGSIRYVDVVLRDGRAHYFHEYARDDTAQELRHASVPIA